MYIYYLKLMTKHGDWHYQVADKSMPYILTTSESCWMIPGTVDPRED